jgi:tetratricopeptide (TPR) repeat protein
MKIFQEAEALLAQGTAESMRLAVKKYEEALSILRAIGEREGEAVVLSRSGYAYNLLGEKQKALDFYKQALGLHRAVGNRRGEALSLNDLSLPKLSHGMRISVVA